MIIKNKKWIDYAFLFACFLSCVITIFFTSRYSIKWIADPDAANSPIVWKEFLDYGFSAFKHWRPTFDNWYFTVYPVNFFLFFILNDTGIAPLVLSSAIFIMIINICSAKLADHFFGKGIAILALVAVTFISPDLYMHYYGHPFSHNSTNAFGFLILITYIFSIASKNLVPALIIFSLCIVSAASDPWILPAFILPMLLAEAYNLYLNRWRKYYFLIILVAFVISLFNVVQHVFGLPIGGFKITSIDQMIVNAHNAIILTASMLPLWLSPNVYIAYAIFFVWVAVFLSASLHCIKKGGSLRMLAIFCALSVAGIYSSSIIGDQVPHQRFYVNIAPIVLMVVSISTSISRKHLIPLVVTVCMSLFGYLNSPYMRGEFKNPVYDYMAFMLKNNLTYGYGSFWYSMGMSVNWLSNNQIHFTPVFFDVKTGRVYFEWSRIQTLTTWHTKEFVAKGPNRQFIAVTPGSTGGDTCPDVNLCINGVQKQIGKADEILKYNNTTFLVYNKPIITDIK
ncbi:TPA: hypothetical protein N8Q04_001481 [Escherichia fergusonii]|uniref:hypothetical protein n=1 Tax=Escherichia fergusonii TaxID=564 RepID=UPI0015E98549|nr:hypothetical protein [Escherichia fergusonii]MEB8048465.1 hypothetical protein [Escherichia fergusonii]MEB8052252.1 hypothetical protein [Escherichia fergusonii]QMF19708.1 hypothetical protein HVY91_20220 [Escherichia fergusonii]QMH58195.1 hypothetical protein HVY30_06300 [Escherichia fergusonii]HCO4392937.1 hypothetical protein [Escherichia fergusonii]